MPRRGVVAKREVLPDPVYNSVMVTRLVNNVMYDGKKGVAYKIVYSAFDIVKEKTGNDPLEAFEKAMNAIMPELESRLVVSVVRLIRFRLKSARHAARHWVFAGSRDLPVSAVNARWLNALQVR